jgi:ribonucleoside-triphosphate reductase
MEEQTRDVESIDREIETLRARLANVQGTPTEIYTRIVGYYRSLTNWNKGKREEYLHRRTFAPAAETQPSETRTAEAPTDEAEPQYESRRSMAAAEYPSVAAQNRAAGDSEVVSSYAYFFRKTCPNCPPVRSLLEATELGGDHFDVDTDEGFSKAAEMQILATPTVVFFDGNGEQVGRANAPKDAQRFLAFAE